ncbi:hypothetical protein IscW_ISCW006605 [Ixodes scapularis]|uniref:Ig-like domain-containing protein n=1 Tax=Ixodes scapularis TaxID=6945 RepID=B7PN83_IXOSC|nr:hypothetical protein IscW_ISCW006605 [Ixodes scapularis]|eukprot:XP_002435231.1 hypothetical protein IscW_ISCW006605 [Ixodes scapularis]
MEIMSLLSVLPHCMSELVPARDDEGASITGRRWFRRGLDGTFTQVALDVHGEVTLNRRYVTSDHALVVRNATETDVGFYVCHDNEEPPDEYRMEYLLDGERSFARKTSSLKWELR